MKKAMERPELKELYQQLMRSKYSFVPRGTMKLRDVYEHVEREFPNLCDNEYRCSEHCTGGYNSPEWQHQVRTALNMLKDAAGPVRHSGRRGEWSFA